MLPLQADVTIDEVLNHDGWCKSGHETVKSWSREGPGTPAVPTRYFRVSSDVNSSVDGVYCELCLVLANAHARRTKMEMKNGTKFSR